MSYPAPTLHVEPSGGMGEFFVRVEGELRPVQLLYQPDQLDQGGEWITGPRLELPGLYRISGFNNFNWYVLTALHVNKDGAPISAAARPVKSRPEFQLPTYSLDLVRENSLIDVAGRTNAYRSRIKAWPVRGFTDGAIFLYRRELFGTGANTRDVFIAVCKPGDLDYPVGDVGDGPYYRLDYVDLIERNADWRTENWATICDDVDELIDALELDDIYRTGEVQ
jgi:hypothetical protein